MHLRGPSKPGLDIRGAMGSTHASTPKPQNLFAEAPHLRDTRGEPAVERFGGTAQVLVQVEGPSEAVVDAADLEARRQPAHQSRVVVLDFGYDAMAGVGRTAWGSGGSGPEKQQKRLPKPNRKKPSGAGTCSASTSTAGATAEIRTRNNAPPASRIGRRRKRLIVCGVPPPALPLLRLLPPLLPPLLLRPLLLLGLQCLLLLVLLSMSRRGQRSQWRFELKGGGIKGRRGKGGCILHGLAFLIAALIGLLLHRRAHYEAPK